MQLMFEIALLIVLLHTVQVNSITPVTSIAKKVDYRGFQLDTAPGNFSN